MRDASPLRYPGGKWRFASFFETLIAANFKERPVYFEPYAGGASLALSLLFAEKVSEIYLNDLNPAVYAFWYCVLNREEMLSELLEATPVTPEEWQQQKATYQRGTSAGVLALGFATFFLNRTNHSGILNGGMIGGKAQRGEWQIDARFNRRELVRRVKRVASFRERIHLSCVDAMEFLRRQRRGTNTLVYLDPPYFGAGGHDGRHLYLNAYRPSDHAKVRDRISTLRCPWLVSYDDVPAIRRLYRGYRSRRVRLLHTARTARQAEEVIYFSPALTIPSARRQ
jgi:DNA adenine methylase